MISRIARHAAAFLIALSSSGQCAIAQEDNAQERLTRAIRANDANEVAAAIQSGADPTKPVNEFCDAAYLALSYANADVLRRMIELGVDFRRTNPPTRSPLRTILAKSAASPEAVRVVMDAGWDEINGLDSNFLGTPAAVRSEKITRMLLEGGCAADGPVAEHWKPIIYAAWRGTAPVVTALAEAHADVDAPGPGGRTPLHFAAIRTDRDAGEVVAALATAGADVDAKDDQGFTPLLLAIYRGGATSLAALLKAKADPNLSQRGGMTPLAYAAVVGSLEQMRLLLEFGADPNARTLNGATILEAVLMKASFEHAETLARKRKVAFGPRQVLVELAASDPVARVNALLEGGADPNEIGATGWTPLMLACSLWVSDRTPKASGRPREEVSWTAAASDVAAFIERHNPADIVRLLAAKGAKRAAPDSPLIEMDVAAVRGDLRSQELMELLGTIPMGTTRVEPARPRDKDLEDLVEPTF